MHGKKLSEQGEKQNIMNPHIAPGQNQMQATLVIGKGSLTTPLPLLPKPMDLHHILLVAIAFLYIPHT